MGKPKKKSKLQKGRLDNAVLEIRTKNSVKSIEAASDSENNVQQKQTQDVKNEISVKLCMKKKRDGKRESSEKPSGFSMVDAVKVIVKSKINYDSEDVKPARAVDVKNDVALKLKAKTKADLGVSSEKKLDSSIIDVVSKIAAPAFSPMNKSFVEPLHQNKTLHWDHKVNLIGFKVINPPIHCCEMCNTPIVRYGRLNPCKHVLCYDCAKKTADICPKCGGKTDNIEPMSFGRAFICTFGGSSSNTKGSCGRTYCSQRDLEAHVNLRHVNTPSSDQAVSAATVSTCFATINSRLGNKEPIDQSRKSSSWTSYYSSYSSLFYTSQSYPSSYTMGSAPKLSWGDLYALAGYQNTMSVSTANSSPMTVPVLNRATSRMSTYAPTTIATAISCAVPSTQHLETAYAPTTVATALSYPIQSTQHLGTAYAPTTVAAALSSPIPSTQHLGTAYALHPYQHQTPSTAYLQAPPTATPIFTQSPLPVHQQPTGIGARPIYSKPPPPVHHQPEGIAAGLTFSVPPPPIHHQAKGIGARPLYSTPPPPIHHPLHRASYTPPLETAPQQSQSFQGAASYMSPSWPQV